MKPLSASRKQVCTFILIMVGTAIGVAMVTLAILYHMEFDRQRNRLAALAQSQARLIETIARFETQLSSEHVPESALAATLEQVREAHKKFAGFGKTGAFILAKRDGDKIVLLLRQRPAEVDDPDTVPFSSNLAESMRRALSGQSGTIIGFDYRGVKVLAAFEPVDILNWGLVAKIDLAEIRSAFVYAGLVTVGSTALLVLLGTLLFVRISHPLLRRVEENEQKYRILFESATDGVFLFTDVFLDCNDQACRLFGCRRKDIIGQKPAKFFPPLQADGPDSVEVIQELSEAALAGTPQSFSLRCQPLDGVPIETDISLKGIVVRGQKMVLASVRDVTERQRSEAALRASEERFRNYFEQGILGMVIASPTKQWLAVNERLCEMLGYSHDELMGKTWPELTHPDDLEPTLDRFNRVLEGGVDGYSLEKRYIRKDGSIIYANVSARCLRRDDGSVDHFIVLLEDITERKLAEASLAEKTEELRVISEALGVLLEKKNWKEALSLIIRTALHRTASEYGFAAVLMDGPILRMLCFEGITWSETIGREFYEAAMKSYEEAGHLDFTNLNNLFGHIATSGQTVISNQPATDSRSGGLPPGHAPLRNFLGVPVQRGEKLVGVLAVANREGEYSTAEQTNLELVAQATAVIYDAYLRERHEAALQRQLRRGDKLASLGTLAAGAAHEILNPANIISLNAQGHLMEEGLSENQRKSFQIIVQQVERISKICGALRRFSRLDVEQRTAFNLHALIEETVQLLGHELRLNRIDVRMQFDERLDEIVANRDELAQAFLNLCTDAKDAMPQGGTLTFTTEGFRRHGTAWVRINVQDTGEGIAPEVIDRIFDPFFTTKAQDKGTGLGLSIAHGILEAHGGSIRVSSVLGAGTTFTIELPLASTGVGEGAFEDEASLSR